jgi:biopolymer transport protein TolR
MSMNAGGTVQSTPNVTPMIDVMLVLLIIFLIITPVIVNGVDAEPPKASALQPRPEDEGDRTLVIDAAGRYYVDRVPVAHAVLGERLRAIFAMRASDKVLYLRAHKDLDYARVLEAIDIARQNGVRVVGLVSEQTPRSPESATR